MIFSTCIVLSNFCWSYLSSAHILKMNENSPSQGERFWHEAESFSILQFACCRETPKAQIIMRKAVVLGIFGARSIKCLNDKEPKVKENTSSWERLGECVHIWTCADHSQRVEPSRHHGFPPQCLLGSVRLCWPCWDNHSVWGGSWGEFWLVCFFKLPGLFLLCPTIGTSLTNQNLNLGLSSPFSLPRACEANEMWSLIPSRNIYEKLTMGKEPWRCKDEGETLSLDT